MADYADLLSKAKALGEALAAHAVVREYHVAQKAAKEDKAAQALIRSHQTQLAKIQQLEAERKPIEVGDKQALRGFEQQMAGSETLKRLMRAQADYIDLMNRVNQAMDAPLTELVSEMHA